MLIINSLDLSSPELETHKNVVNSYGIWTPLAGKIPQVQVISRISSNSTDFGGKCVFGRKVCRIHGKGRFKVILTTSKTLIFLRNYCYFCPRGRRRVGIHQKA